MRVGKRITAALVLACMVGALLWGSQYQETGQKEELPGLSLLDRKETIYFWYTQEDLAEFLNGAAVAFSEKNQVRVIPQLVSAGEYLEAVNDATLHSEQIPDVYLLSNDSLEKAYLAGLASMVEDPGGLVNEAHFPPAALHAVTYHGKPVAYPFYFDTTALLYNRTYLEEWLKQQTQGGDEGSGGDAGSGGDEESGADAEEKDGIPPAQLQQLLTTGIPQTMDEILFIANTFDVPEGVEGVMKWDVADIFYNYWIIGSYMNVGGEDGDGRTQIDIYNDQTLQCLETYKNLNQFFYIESDAVTYDSAIEDFLAGKTVFTIAAVDAADRLRQAKAEGSFPYEYGFAPMPEVSGSLQSRSLSVTGAAVVNGYSEHRELANAFAAFLTGEYSGQLYDRTGRAAACLEADQKELAAFLTEYGESVPMPKMIETSNLWIHLEVLFSRIWNGEDVPKLLGGLSDQIQLQLGNPVG